MAAACVEPAGCRNRCRDRSGRPWPAITKESTMRILRPATAAAALGAILLLGACFGGHTATPAPAPYTVPSVPATGNPPPSPKDPASNAAPPSTVAPPVAPAPPRYAAPPIAPAPPRYAAPPIAPAPPRYAAPPIAPAPMIRPPAPAPPRVAPPAPRPMVPPPPARVPAGNDHDADNNGGPDDGDGNR